MPPNDTELTFNDNGCHFILRIIHGLHYRSCVEGKRRVGLTSGFASRVGERFESSANVGGLRWLGLLNVQDLALRGDHGRGN